MKINAVCPVCRTLLTWEDPQKELWGSIEIGDLGCVSVTRGHDPEVQEHLDGHLRDGSWLPALNQNMRRLKENADHYLAAHPEAAAPTR